jgi:hypothetical protein
MAIDRSIRSLCALSAASSNRVLNLIAIADANQYNEKHRNAPLFQSKIINASIILKHRLRADEMDLFVQRRALATKIIIPFERGDLKVGGQSLFIGQSGFQELLEEVGNYRDQGEMKRDLDVMRLIDGVPSLDPFLLREHLRCNDIMPDSCYFAISEADQQRMYDYAAQEISRLTALAGAAGAQSYYKWSLEEYWPDLIRALCDIKSIRAAGKVSLEEKMVLDESKQLILRGARDNSREIRRIIGIYDSAYAGMIDRQDAKQFREFLLGAPKLFLDIGDKMGALSHITSFWNYRFPVGAPRAADAEELIAIFHDFTRGLMSEMALAA